ncbi:MAG: orotidine-5'-phosphate decarboxylase [Clostridiales bacterium]
MKDKLIVALDVATRKEAFQLVKQLDGEVGAYKIGMQLYNSEGPDIVRDIQCLGGRVFVDLKFHDIPNTVAQASRVITRRQAFMFTMHAYGGYKMLKDANDAAREEAQALGIDKPLSLAVTVLTSMSQKVFEEEVGINRPIADQVVAWAKLSQKSGLDGVVCSPWEITSIRQACGDDFIIVTPGVRPSWAASNDQERIMTPKEAVQRGATYLVVGRPITTHHNPKEAARMIVAEMEEAVANK